LELSSFQLETTTSLVCETVTILNVVEDHMDRYQGFADYRRVKHQIYRQSRNIVTNRDDNHTHADMAGSSFGLNAPEHIGDIGLIDGQIVRKHSAGVKKVCAAADLALVGTHNLANAMAAIALLAPFKLEDQQLAATLATFGGLAHRCELVQNSGLVRWVNDSKATNVGATIAALSSIRPLCDGKLILIAGGVGKGADFTPLKAPLQADVDCLITLGQDGPAIAELFNGKVDHVDSLQQAVAIADKLAESGDWVLLSPACASMDMFVDYQQRGEQFKALVGEVYDVN
jgi:UDP-N-acetylmuramoylalanine--D-glutamate ligase